MSSGSSTYYRWTQGSYRDSCYRDIAASAQGSYRDSCYRDIAASTLEDAKRCSKVKPPPPPPPRGGATVAHLPKTRPTVRRTAARIGS